MSRSFHSYEAARDWLFSLRNRGSKYGLGRMERFLELLGHPQEAFPCIHVAGTNGKGSVCAMLERMYRATGLRVGLFTSPHLVHQGERIQVDRCRLDEKQILHYSNELLPVAAKVAQRDQDNHPSFFEWMTAMAFLHFRKMEVDLAVLETGLGGRLDSTNVVRPEASVITSVGFDHMELLGDTLPEIAREKAGIIKPGRPVVVGRMPVEARQAIERIAMRQDAEVHPVEDSFAGGDLPKTNLAGSVQAWNAATAVLTCKVLDERFPVPGKLAGAALQDVFWMGRWSEHRAGARRIILDAAHNADALESLCENLASLDSPPYVVAGFTGSEERARALLPMLESRAAEVILVQPSHPHGLAPEDLGHAEAGTIQQLFPEKSVCTVGPAYATVVVTGSMYLVAEIYERLHYETSQGHQMLQD